MDQREHIAIIWLVLLYKEALESINKLSGKENTLCNITKYGIEGDP